MDQDKKVSIIVVSYNTKALTEKCLRSIFASAVLSEEVAVVDNNSSDGSVEMIRSQFPQVKLIENKENVGFAKANNQALKIAKGKYAWLLNSDTEIGAKVLSQLVDFMESNISVAAVSPQLVYPDGKWQSVGGFFPKFGNVFLYMFPFHGLLSITARKKLKLISIFPQKVSGKINLDYVTGAAMFLRMSSLEKTGLLGEEYFMYFEETDLCWRLRKNGWGIFGIETDPVVHVYGGSFKKKTDTKRLRLFADSLKIFVKKNYYGFERLVILLEIKIFFNISIFVKNLKS